MIIELLMSLYDVVPPTLFFLSIGGVLVILARAVQRMRQAAFSQAVKNDAIVTVDTRGLLEPRHKSVHVISSRLGLAARGVKSSFFATKNTLHNKVKFVFEHINPASLVKLLRSNKPSFFNRLGDAARRSIFRRKEEIVVIKPVQTSTEKSAAQPEVIAPAVNIKKGIITRVVTVADTTHLEKPASVVSPQDTAAEPMAVNKRNLLQRVKKKSIIAAANEAIGAHDLQRAEDLLVDHIVKHTKDTKAYILLGQVALARKSWAEAAEIFEQVLQWQPNAPGIQSQLGSAAFHAGQLTKALQALQRAHDEEPDNQIILQQLLMIARNMDNPALQSSITKKLKVQQPKPAKVH